jgi:hypothetical protein
MKVNTQIAFTNFRKIQGNWWWVVCLVDRTTHTHAQIEINFEHPFTFLTMLDRKPSVVRQSYLTRLGARTYATYDLGEIDISDADLAFATNYPSMSAWKMLLYRLGGKWFGMEQPKSCVTFICDYLRWKGYDSPNLFSPRELWENLNASNNAWWSSPSRQDNPRQMDK